MQTSTSQIERRLAEPQFLKARLIRQAAPPEVLLEDLSLLFQMASGMSG